MKIHISVVSLILILFLFSCKSDPKRLDIATSIVNEIETPSKIGGEANLFVSETKQVYLTWIEYLNDTTDALLFSTLQNETWTRPKTIAQGSNWFVNWADFPSLVEYGSSGKNLAAHWLQKSAKGTYDYDIMISQSNDGGETWKNPFILHKDGIHAEHGFVTMLPISDSKVFATWLDGRKTKLKDNNAKHEHGHTHQGAMTLRTAVLDQNGILSEEAELDDRICDCCQTTAAKTSEGIIVAYRDRSENEIRDISVVRKINEQWSKPKNISEDNWLIEGCPVNGPALDAMGSSVVLAWFTMKDEHAQVKVKLSRDNGRNFSSSIQIDEGNPIGRVDAVMISEHEALISWLEQKAEGSALNIVKINQNGIKGEPFTIKLNKTYTQSGFPRMVKHGEQIIFAWTEKYETSIVKTAIMDLH